MIKAKVKVTLKNGVLDPQGQAIESALNGLGFAGINNVRQGRYFELEIENDISKAHVEKMCKKLLANTVIENYEIELDQQ